VRYFQCRTHFFLYSFFPSFFDESNPLKARTQHNNLPVKIRTSPRDKDTISARTKQNKHQTE
jgi:hypothetical protein